MLDIGVFMRIKSVLASNAGVQTFTAGKVNVYSDFDGTYFPSSHSRINNLQYGHAKWLNEYFYDFGNFLNNSKDDINFKITTGRTFGEFKTIAKLLKSKGFSMPLPDALITKNGSDEYLKVNSDENFYKSCTFPFDYKKANLKKQEAIKDLTGWNGQALRPKIYEALRKFNFKVVEFDSEHGVNDYGRKSLFSHTGYDNFMLYGDNMPPKSHWLAGLRKDGSLKYYLSFPYDMLNVSERRGAYGDIRYNISKYLKNSGVKFVMEEFCDKDGGNRPVIVISPKIDGKPLDKLYDTKEAVRKAVINNDFVIAAGDGSNDFEMLNPLNYIDKSDLHPDLQKQLAGLTDENIDKVVENPLIVRKLRKLPFIGIVIKDDNNGLDKLYKLFGKYGKVIEVERGNLPAGIKNAIKMYSMSKPEFLSSMSQNLKVAVGIMQDEIWKYAIKLLQWNSITKF